MMDRFPNEILRDAALDEIEAKPQRARNPIDHWAPAVLLERAAYLRKLARHGDGCASETLKEFPQHIAMLSFRSRSGEAEAHEWFADLFVVLAGSATLLTGGVVMAPRSIGPGETRGAAIEGGTKQTLRAGDLAHVPAATPHQFLLKGEETITCLVMKVQEVV
jgi:mannose-6-phosphate isomerase-like protein (cupin superfamily)